MRKWEFITFLCQKAGFEKSAEIAYEIDQILLQLYEKEHTERWIKEYNKIQKVFNTHKNNKPKLHYLCKCIAYQTKYCVACEEHRIRLGGKHSIIRCNECYFANLAGKCRDEDSLFKQFIKTIDEEFKKITEGEKKCLVEKCGN